MLFVKYYVIGSVYCVLMERLHLWIAILDHSCVILVNSIFFYKFLTIFSFVILLHKFINVIVNQIVLENGCEHFAQALLEILAWLWLIRLVVEQDVVDGFHVVELIFYWVFVQNLELKTKVDDGGQRGAWAVFAFFDVSVPKKEFEFFEFYGVFFYLGSDGDQSCAYICRRIFVFCQ